MKADIVYCGDYIILRLAPETEHDILLLERFVPEGGVRSMRIEWCGEQKNKSVFIGPLYEESKGEEE
jgi:hypothetical protein